MEGASTEYLRGFTHGMHFLLQSLEGRLTGCADPWDIELALREYRALVQGAEAAPARGIAATEFSLADVAW